MGNNLKVAIQLLVDSHGMAPGFRQARRGLRGFVRGVQHEFGALRRVLGSVQGQLAGLGASVGVVALALKSARLDKTLIQVGQTAGVSREEVERLRASLFRMGKKTGESIEELAGGFNNLVQAGLDWRQALATIEAINPAMTITGANAQVLASGLTVAAEAFRFDLGNLQTARSLLDKMVVAGRLGNAELEDLASIFARVGVNAKAAGFSFDQTLAFIEQLSQIERQPERLATLADSTLRIFTNRRYLEEAAAVTGVSFFTGSGARRDPTAVFGDIAAKFARFKTDQERADAIAAAFGQTDLDTQRGLRTLLADDNVTGIARMAAQISQAGGALERDLDDAMNNAVDQSRRLARTLREAADAFAQPVNDAIERGIKFLLDSKDKGGLGLSGKQLLGGGAAVASGALLAARYGGPALKALSGRLTGRLGSIGAGVATGKALEQAAGVTPVFVVNMPAHGIAGGAVEKAIGSARTGLLARLAPLAAPAGKLGLALAAGAGVGTLIHKGIEGTRVSDAIGRAVAKALAFFGHNEARETLALEREREMQGQINIRIDQDGKARVTSVTKTGGGPDIEVDTGITGYVMP